MQFTPQQLTGGARYGKRCRIGNWSEDQELEELKLKDYLKKKEYGELLVNERQRKLDASLKPAELSAKSEDNSLKFGSTIMLASHKTEGFLAVNPFEQIQKEEVCRAVTSTHYQQPCVRNVLVIERASATDGFGESDVVHYGQDSGGPK